MGSYIYTSLSLRSKLVAPTNNLVVDLIKLRPAYKTNNNKNLKTASLSNEPDCLRTTPSDIDFFNVSSTLFSSESAESLQVRLPSGSG